MDGTLSRRGMVQGGMMLALVVPIGLASSARQAKAIAAHGPRHVETSLGSVEIPGEPRRVLAVDSRISLESALALDLPLIGYSHSRARPWVPVPADVPMLAAPPDLEQILMLRPDLILCPDTAPHSDWWPLARLSAVAPVLPSDHRATWQTNLVRLACWLNRMDLAQVRLAEHAAHIAAIRARHAAALAAHRVAALYYDPLKRQAMVCSAGTAYGQVMPAQVLAELGGREIAAERLGRYGEVALEAFGSVLGEADALLLLDFGNGAPQALALEPLWRRLPAVRDGRVHLSQGNSTFGSFYTARHLADAWDAVYGRLRA